MIRQTRESKEDARQRRAFSLERIVVNGFLVLSLLVTIATMLFIALAVGFVIMMGG